MLHVLAAIALGLLAIAAYPLLCMVSPFGTCRRCKGDGYRLDRKAKLKRCKRCKTTGKRARIGRRIYNRWARIHEHGTR